MTVCAICVLDTADVNVQFELWESVYRATVQTQKTRQRYVPSLNQKKGSSLFSWDRKRHLLRQNEKTSKEE